jgi:hypothetical protein
MRGWVRGISKSVGILEYWNVGKLGFGKASFHYSITPNH